MALPSFLQRKSSPTAAPSADVTGDESAAVQQARTRARRRLIGALVLLAIGVVVFPMVFETQPRPLPRDIPIELPKREVAAAPRSPTTEATREPAGPALAAEGPVAASAAASQARALVSDMHMATAPAPAVPSVDGGAAARAATDVQVAKATAKPGDRPAHEPAGKASAAKASADRPESAAVARKTESERVQALLDAQPAPASAAASEARGPRFVVQVGAYTDTAMLREVRGKVEKLGLKTYTQSINTEAGQRTRVRVGPFTTRAEAETASGKLKGAGLPGNVLVL